MTELIRLVERYVEIPAVSGAERPLREQILTDLSGCCDCRVDPLGNILAAKKGASAAKVSVLLDAHMDEVGLIVTGDLCGLPRSAVLTTGCCLAGGCVSAM